MMANAQLVTDLKAGWAALAAGDMDTLAGFYAEDMIFVLPGQQDVLEGRVAFRKALDGIGQALPPGFDIKDLRYCPGDNAACKLRSLLARGQSKASRRRNLIFCYLVPSSGSCQGVAEVHALA